MTFFMLLSCLIYSFMSLFYLLHCPLVELHGGGVPVTVGISNRGTRSRDWNQMHQISGDIYHSVDEYFGNRQTNRQMQVKTYSPAINAGDTDIHRLISPCRQPDFGHIVLSIRCKHHLYASVITLINKVLPRLQRGSVKKYFNLAQGGS